MNLAFATAALLLSGCVTNHDVLAEQPAGSGGFRPVGASGGKPGSSGGTRGSGGSSGDAAQISDVVVGPAEPPGPRKLTLLHGVIDSPWVAFCVAPVRGGTEGALSAALVPPAGLDYGHSFTTGSVDGVDLSRDGVHVYVVAAVSKEVVVGLDCAGLIARARELADPQLPRDAAPPDAAPQSPRADASPVPKSDASPTDASSSPTDGAVPLALDASRTDARPPRPSHDAGAPHIPAVRVAPLPVVPAGSFSVSESYLLVAGGCIGGPGVADPSQQSVCGEGYTAASPTLTELVVKMTRMVPAGHVGLEFLDGTPALPMCDLALVTGPQSDPLEVARKVVTGAVRPAPPITDWTAADIGAAGSDAAVELFASGSTSPDYKQPWGKTFDAGGFSALADGKQYTLVAIGPYPGFSKRNWWNDPLVTIVQNDP